MKGFTVEKTTTMVRSRGKPSLSIIMLRVMKELIVKKIAIYIRNIEKTFPLWRDLDKHWLIYSDKKTCISLISAKPSLYPITVETICKGEKP